MDDPTYAVVEVTEESNNNSESEQVQDEKKLTLTTNHYNQCMYYKISK